MQRNLSFSLVVVLSVAVIGAILSLVFTRFLNFSAPALPTTLSTTIPQAQPAASGSLAPEYNPPKPEQAPENIRDVVLLGYSILTDTQKNAAGYVGNKLSCTNCHFNGGLTGGGKNGGISLVGVAATYPKYRDRQKYAVALVARTNDCFQRSMNGKALPADGKEMTAILTYYQWIAKGLAIYADVPWLGVENLQSSHQADAAAGSQVFAAECSPCHGQDGQGTSAAPPLWGNNSYNDGAGMASPQTLAAFAHLNMPKGSPNLTVEQALDIGAHVDSQPRPHFAQ